MSIVGSDRLHNLHMSLFRLIALQAVQKYFMSSLLDMFWLANDKHISLMITWISSIFSTCKTAPLTCLAYLLTAVCVIPKSFAISVCLSPYDCVSSFAIYALKDGMTDFTAISHGIDNCVFAPFSDCVQKPI